MAAAATRDGAGIVHSVAGGVVALMPNAPPVMVPFPEIGDGHVAESTDRNTIVAVAENRAGAFVHGREGAARCRIGRP